MVPMLTLEIANHFLWSNGGVVGFFVELSSESMAEMTNINFISQRINMSQHEFPIEIFDILDVDYQMLINSDENENSN